MSENNFSSFTSIPKSWPFEEAVKLVDRIKNKKDKSDKPALLETGYGPSGLPHIGTFGEVARTSWVRQAYQALTGQPVHILAFSDDMDGLRKVPDNVPNKDMLAQHLNKQLSRIPDPFGTHDSFGAHNNAQLCSFLDRFGFEYEFASATNYYNSGRFDAALKRVLEVHDEIVAVVGKTLREERRATYSPVLPIHPETGIVMQVPMEKIDPVAGTVAWRDENGKFFETLVTGGHAKLQWKADWAMRWYALGVDYEMSGKDLIDSVKLSSKICKILGGEPPINLTYELFLDDQGQKISKSKGNGLSIEEWLQYAPEESLALYMYNAPKRAKRLFFDVIPKATDEYLKHVSDWAELEKNKDNLEAAEKEKIFNNPAWFIHQGKVPEKVGSPISFAMLLNLASVANAERAEILWGFLKRYDESVSPESHPMLSQLVEYALAYYADFIRPHKVYRAPEVKEKQALTALADKLREVQGQSINADELQNMVFAVGKEFEFEPLRAWFGCLYEVLLGQKEGPRFGMFIALYGVSETIELIETALTRE
ncbi:lysine--tRNA ligase [Commensalibacter papalotli (ex Botero et al. 2024)]|uniref:Lysine--tRNA ligase n=1 Tax=Commensalibacter papalotli (ex Botero et al. 2024) TaxID=2972766 RepID=A0ABN8WA62_9PROT|nr:lysine--tRNA ligase [Commensalibacter papalotli (ex Botero et al. 2024)]CAI3923989.1 Lysyl-tRNA synthetase [Commensalibacter papalotli (ex Botero et al. 2024)]CAI3928041.1 Lysyl-tRNA synthetase [Commensalibacter papalotli (ex Botero et al. 2024)]